MKLKASEWQKLLESVEGIRKALGLAEENMKVEFQEDGLFIRGEANVYVLTLAIKIKETHE